MKPENFVYWLQGFVEISDKETLSAKEWQVIKDHLKLVFDKQTPDRSDITPSLIQNTLDKYTNPLIYKPGQIIC